MPSRAPERPPITVLLVDDHALVRTGFRRMLEDDPSIRVVGEAGDGPEAVAAAVEKKPDVIVMDYALPSMNGALATKKILAALPNTGILMLSMHPEPVYVRQCMDAGARGYLLKSALDLELVEAVKALSAGGRVMDRRLALAPDGAAEEKHASLTPRELEVLQLIVHGKSNKDIAVVLGVSVHTVAAHRARIMQALGLHNAAELVVFAIRSGLVSVS